MTTMHARDHGRPRRTRVKRPRSPVRKKGGACSFAVPVVAASLLLLAVQALAVRWHTRGAK